MQLYSLTRSSWRICHQWKYIKIAKKKFSKKKRQKNKFEMDKDNLQTFKLVLKELKCKFSWNNNYFYYQPKVIHKYNFIVIILMRNHVLHSTYNNFMKYLYFILKLDRVTRAKGHQSHYLSKICNKNVLHILLKCWFWLSCHRHSKVQWIP